MTRNSHPGSPGFRCFVTPGTVALLARRTRKVGVCGGKPVFDTSVSIECSGLGWDCVRVVRVLAESPAAAANAVLDEFGGSVGRPMTVVALGVRGGHVVRYQGWEGAIGREIEQALLRRQQDQLSLPLPPIHSQTVPTDAAGLT